MYKNLISVRRKYTASTLQTKWIVLFMEIISDSCDIPNKLINTQSRKIGQPVNWKVCVVHIITMSV